MVLLRGAARAADPDDADAGRRPGRPAQRGLDATSRRTAAGAARERWDSLQALVALADDLAAAPPTGSGPPTVADLVAELDERAVRPARARPSRA